MPQKQVPLTHSTSTFTVSRERQKPASSMVKPACMPNTRKPAISVQSVFIGLISVFLVLSAFRSCIMTGCVVVGSTAAVGPEVDVVGAVVVAAASAGAVSGVVAGVVACA